MIIVGSIRRGGHAGKTLFHPVQQARYQGGARVHVLRLRVRLLVPVRFFGLRQSLDGTREQRRRSGAQADLHVRAPAVLSALDGVAGAEAALEHALAVDAEVSVVAPVRLAVVEAVAAVREHREPGRRRSAGLSDGRETGGRVGRWKVCA